VVMRAGSRQQELIVRPGTQLNRTLDGAQT
jgi:hypothetical protein